MRRAGKLLLWLLGVVVLLPVLAVGALWLGLNTGPGRALAERNLAKFTGGMVVAQGISGRFPDALRLRHLEIHDAQGAWLLADDVLLDWSPARLLQRVARIDRLEAARLQLPRLPAANPSAAAPAAPSQPYRLPVRVEAARIHVARAEIGAPVLGAAAVVSIDGQADLPSLEAGAASLDLHRLDGEGVYTLTARLDPASMDAKLAIAEPEGGLVAQLASLPNLGPLRVEAALKGPRDALATTLAIAAGPLRADATGTLDLVRLAADLNVTGAAPAMTPAPNVSWQAIQLQARVRGPFTAPDASGRLRVEGLAAAGAGLRLLAADIDGNAGRVGLHATAEGLRLPGPDPALLAATPLTLDGAVRLDDPARPATFTLSHALISATGQARTAGDPDITADLRLPDLAPFAALGGIELRGSTALRLHALVQGGATKLDADGTLGLTGGLAPLPGLIGDAAAIGLSAQLHDDDIRVTRLELAGRTLRLSAQASRIAGRLEGRTTIGLTDLAVLAPTVSGAVQAEAQIQGTMDDLALTATLAGQVGVPGVPRGPVKLSLALRGLPGAPQGTISGEGALAGAPLSLALNASRSPDGALHATIDRAAWRSLHAEGALTLPAGATVPQGRVALRLASLADLSPFVGQSLSGALTADLDLDPREARLHADLRGAGIPGSRVAHAVIAARVADPAARPVVNATVALDGLDASGVTGSVKLDVAGPQDALALRTNAALQVAGTDMQIGGAALLNATAQHVVVGSLQVVARGETIRLLAPATIRYAGAVAVDRLRVGVRQAVLDVAGQLSPRLNATVALRAPADLLAIAAPDLALDGVITLDAQLTGTPALPGGAIRLAATGLRMRTGPGRALPPAALTATAQLAGAAARIEARLAAGSAQLTLAGTAPLGAGPLNLRASGSLDLALLDPILSPGGRRARGRVAVDATVAGTAAAPRIAGAAQLTGGELQDFSQGVHVTAIAASLRAEGDTLRIVSLTGRAGPGTVAAAGSIGVLLPGLPLDLAITLRNARPLASDRLTADLDADLTLRGSATGALQVAGRVVVRRAEIRIPESLPATIAVLDVRRPGQRPPAPAAAGAAIGLDLTVAAPGAVFVRGRGVDAELSGQLRIRGSSIQPQVTGGLEMRRGLISLAGTTLTFSRGKIGFDGTGVTGKIDPTLDFAADSTAGGVTATLSIEGYASAPKIKLSSVPDLPQDEVLAYLLFKRSAKELGPFQIAEIAAALASLTGVGGSGANPLESIRRGLGLDRLSVGGGSSTSSAPSVEAGRYVANGVYVGAKQGATGGGTGATVQIDITKGLKLQTDVGTGEGGNQVGVTYQFEY